MNTKNSKRSGRVVSKKVTISYDAKYLTSKSGLVPVVTLESQLIVTRILSCFLRLPATSEASTMPIFAFNSSVFSKAGGKSSGDDTAVDWCGYQQAFHHEKNV